ncbi:hypothetical protein NL676_004266 [Syzygium grande]|nr:hypothetical protein NL676_004266 [Syzygium grande]
MVTRELFGPDDGGRVDEEDGGRVAEEDEVDDSGRFHVLEEDEVERQNSIIYFRGGAPPQRIETPPPSVEPRGPTFAAYYRYAPGHVRL